MCAPIVGHSELVFFITHPKSEPRRNTLTIFFITGPEKLFFETQYGKCASTNKNAEIKFDFQKLKLSFNRFKTKPLNITSSQMGERNAPASMPSQPGASV